MQCLEIFLFMFLLYSHCTLAGLKKKPENWKPRRRHYTVVGSTQTFDDGKTGTEAELAFYSRKLGFVNYDRDRGEFFYLILRRYTLLKSGHELQRESVPWEFLENLSAFMKTELCRKYLNEPLLRYNRIFFDEEASLEKISIVEMTIEFSHHNVPSTVETFIQCPISWDARHGDYLFMTMVERAKFEHQDHYYIFTEVRPGAVAPLLRSKYNTGSLIDDVVGALALTTGKLISKFLDFAVGEIPDDTDKSPDSNAD